MDGCQQGCENTEGGYRCTCPAGLKLKTDGKSLQVDKTCSNSICEGLLLRYVNSSNAQACYCDLGQQVNSGNSSDCIDVDLCASEACTDFCSGTNDNKSYTCSVPSMQKLEADGATCTGEKKYYLNESDSYTNSRFKDFDGVPRPKVKYMLLADQTWAEKMEEGNAYDSLYDNENDSHSSAGNHAHRNGDKEGGKYYTNKAFDSMDSSNQNIVLHMFIEVVVKYIPYLIICENLLHYTLPA
ncbi:hypothetical protein Btru_062838 [Bulinus truncatus]|nr:hypothetical protein Btru_062838 [Bulinus truncatus]